MKTFTAFTGISPDNSLYRNSDHLFENQRHRLYGNQSMRGDYEFNVPRANISQLDEEERTGYLVEMAAPGYDRDDFEISIHNNIMTIEAKLHEDRFRSHETFMHREHAYHTFERKFTLPEHTDEENVTASYDRGILEVFVPVLRPVAQTTAPRQVKINR